jgi:hypothetical protein
VPSLTALPRPPTSRLTWGLAAAAGVLGVFGLVSWMKATRLETELAAEHERLEALSAELGDTTAELLDLRTKLASEEHWSGVAVSHEVKVVLLNPTAAGEPIEGRAYYNPKTGEARIVFYSVTKSHERDFELWAIGSEGPVSLGVLSPNESGTAEVRVPSLASTPGLNAFAVSQEPIGGSGNPRAPSGPVVSVGAIQG